VKDHEEERAMQTTPTIGLKSPEGTDPFLTQDFIDNWGAIDDAIADDRAAIADAKASADTLQGHPASYFYSPDNEPAGGGGGGGGTEDPRPYTWFGAGNINQSKAAGSTTTYVGSRLVAPVAGRLFIDLSVYVAFPAGTPGLVNITQLVDDANASGSNLYSGGAVPDFNLSGVTRMTIPNFGVKDVNAGQHTASFQFSVQGGGSWGPVTLYFWKMRTTLVRTGATF
jgi:hypothetical protein